MNQVFRIMNRSKTGVLVLLAIAGFTTLTHAQLKVDLSRTDRADARSIHLANWLFNPGSPSSTFNGITVKLSKAGDAGTGLFADFYKFGLDHDARMACDGISVQGGDSGGQIEMTITGLAPGPHTIATFHNSLAGPDKPPGRFNVFVNEVLTLSNLQPTIQVTNDADAASAFIRVNAQAGKDVVLRFAGTANVILNGFEIDCSNPAARAVKPVPANGDEHVDADAGPVRLQWTAAASAVSHDVYFGDTAEAVAAAGRASPLFKGNQKAVGLTVTPDRTAVSYWRVDEVDASGAVTKGDVWRFRTRHLAFPTAEGYGRFARGGRGGRVIEVTNLNDRGPGSLREAIEAEGPRTVVFNVSGLITLESRLVIRNPYLTIAGQTAPGNGICIRKYNFGMGGTHDVIVRYVRVRPGNISGTTLDGMGMASTDHSIIDHCSISWTLDEAFSSRGAKNITLQRTLISEALNEAGHKNYPPGTRHGYAASIGGNIGSFHHNLLAHCSGRNWSLAGALDNRGHYAGRLDIRNNVVYNWANRATDGGAHEVNFVANYYKPGPSTRFFRALNAQYGGFPGSQQYYLEGNVMPGYFDVTNQAAGRTATTERGGRIPTEYSPWVDNPFFESHVKTHSAREAYENVLANVGCNFPALDEHDKRVIQEVRDGTFKYRGSKTDLPGLPDSQDDVGGWDNYPEERRPANWDTDHDGMPDEWERRVGLNPSDARDGNADRNRDGYTNLEEYLGSLVGEFPAPRPPAG